MTPGDKTNTVHTPDFSAERCNWIRQLVSESIQQAIDQLASQLGFNARRERSSDLSMSCGTKLDLADLTVIQIIKEDGQSAFKREVVGYFHSDLPSTYGKDDIVYNGKEIIYRDDHTFVDRLQNMVSVYRASAIRTNLVKCLRGRASAWYPTQLTLLEKQRVRATRIAVVADYRRHFYW